MYASTAVMTSANPAFTTPRDGGPVMASQSITNQLADSTKSLYQICLALRQRVSEVPGFGPHLALEMEEGEEAPEDPVTMMWRCLRRGKPLLTIYNTLMPETPLVVDESKLKQEKVGKAASMKFVQACLRELQFPPGDCFVLQDLYGDDTTGFVKVRKSEIIEIITFLCPTSLVLILVSVGHKGCESSVRHPKSKRSIAHTRICR
jgi:cell division control protein 24